MNPKSKSITKTIAAVITIAIAAQVTIDMGSIPITGQTLALLIWAFFLSYKESIVALLIYLILGFIGAPIFADGAHGIEKLYGPSGGYLIGFLIAAGLVSYYKSKMDSNTFLQILGLTAFGTVIILLFGVSRLMMFYGIEKGIAYGFLPFWQGAVVKIMIGSLIVWVIRRDGKDGKN